MQNEEQENPKPKNKKINQMSRTALKKKAREIAKSGQINSKYYEHILARLEGKPQEPTL